MNTYESVDSGQGHTQSHEAPIKSTHRGIFQSQGEGELNQEQWNSWEHLRNPDETQPSSKHYDVPLTKSFFWALNIGTPKLGN